MNKAILVILLVIVVGGGAYVLGKNSDNNKTVAPTISTVTPVTQTQPTVQQGAPATVQKSSVSSYKVVKPNLYVYGSGLATVKVYGTPTGTGVTEDKVLGTATLQGTTNGTQAWVFQPQEDQLLLTSMSVQGFDANGKLVGTINLPYSGASDVYGAFY